MSEKTRARKKKKILGQNAMGPRASCDQFIAKTAKKLIQTKHCANMALAV